MEIKRAPRSLQITTLKMKVLKIRCIWWLISMHRRLTQKPLPTCLNSTIQSPSTTKLAPAISSTPTSTSSTKNIWNNLAQENKEILMSVILSLMLCLIRSTLWRVSRNRCIWPPQTPTAQKVWKIQNSKSTQIP